MEAATLDHSTPRRIGRTTRVVAFVLIAVALGACAWVASGVYVIDRGQVLPSDPVPEVVHLHVPVLGGVYVDDTYGRTDGVGLMALSSLAAFGLLAALALRRLGAERSVSRFFAMSGAAAGYLAVDEFLGLHESVGMNVGELPVVHHTDDAIVLLYLLAGAVFAWTHRGVWLRRSMLAPAAGAAGFALASVMLDAFAATKLEEAAELGAEACVGAGFVVLALEYIGAAAAALRRAY